MSLMRKCCCEGHPPEGNTDPCDIGCCQRMRFLYMQVYSGFAYSGGALDFSAYGSTQFLSQQVAYADCAGGEAVVLTREVGGKWVATIGSPGSQIIFKTIGTGHDCPPEGFENWEFDSAEDGNSYFMLAVDCCQTESELPPDDILFDGWQTTQPATSVTYSAGSPNFALWDGEVHLESPGVWTAGGGVGTNWRSMLCPDGRYLDFQPTASNVGLGNSIRLDWGVATPVSFVLCAWVTIACHAWHGDLSPYTAASDTVLKLSHPVSAGEAP